MEKHEHTSVKPVVNKRKDETAQQMADVCLFVRKIVALNSESNLSSVLRI